jgi:hypothetical protein
MPTLATDLWSLVQNRQYIDPAELACAVDEQAGQSPLDFRTRLLIRDSADVLQRLWGPARFAAWLGRCRARQTIESIRLEDLGKPGFPFLGDQVVETTKPETVHQLLQELGNELHRPLTIYIAGSIALILAGYLVRGTQDLDVVDELPEAIRNLRNREQLEKRYRLQLGHVQSHYLPSGWQNRAHSLDTFGRLNVFLVDVYDVFLSKLFSGREKDRDDLRELLPQLEKEVITRRLRETTGSWLAAPNLVKHAEKNWQILYGEPLPQ